MKPVRIILALLVIVTGGCAEPTPVLRTIDGMEAEFVVTPETATEIGGQIGPDFEVLETGDVILRGSDYLVALEMLNGSLHATSIQQAKPPPASFAIDSGPTMFVVNDRFLGILEEEGYSKAIPLPNDGMRLASSTNKGAFYLYGPIGDDQFRVYSFYEDGVLDVLLELPSAITSIADNRNSVYVATAREILRIRAKGIGLVIRLPEDAGEIVSIAASPDDRVVYFSTSRQVYAFSGVSGIPIVTNAGGTLRMVDDKLYLLDPAQQFLVILSRMTEALQLK